MRLLSILTLVVLFCFTETYAQTLLTCTGSRTGAKVSFVSKVGQDITLRIDWDEGSTFAPANLGIQNGTCEDCSYIGGIGRPHGSFKNWVIRQTDPNQPVTVAWATNGTINYCGGSTPVTIPGTGALLNCTGSENGAKVSFVSKVGQDITLRIDWDENSTFSSPNLDIQNGTCEDCSSIGGIGRPHGIFKNWVIRQTDPNQPVTVAWATTGTISTCGGNTPVTVPETGN